MTPGEAIWAAAVPGMIAGAVLGGSAGLCLACGFLMSWRLGAGEGAFSPTSPVELAVFVLLSVLAGAMAGGTVLGMLGAGLLALCLLLDHLFDLITRPFRRTVDPDADVSDWP